MMDRSCLLEGGWKTGVEKFFQEGWGEIKAWYTSNEITVEGIIGVTKENGETIVSVSQGTSVGESDGEGAGKPPLP